MYVFGTKSENEYIFPKPACAFFKDVIFNSGRKKIKAYFVMPVTIREHRDYLPESFSLSGESAMQIILIYEFNDFCPLNHKV